MTEIVLGIRTYKNSNSARNENSGIETSINQEGIVLSPDDYKVVYEKLNDIKKIINQSLKP